jgi:hypothetical protein
MASGYHDRRPFGTLEAVFYHLVGILCRWAFQCNITSRPLAEQRTSQGSATSSRRPARASASCRMMRPLFSICGKYVDLHRPQIEALAKALLADGIVKANGIRRILGRRTMPVRSVIFEVVAALEHAELERSVAVLVGR